MHTRKALLIVFLLLIFGIPMLGILNGGMGLRSQMFTVSTVAPARGIAMGGNVGYRQDAMMANEGPIAIAPDYVGEAGTSTMMIDKSRISPMMPPVPGNDGFVAGADRAIVKTANISAVVEDVRSAVSKVNEITKAAEGYVTSSNISDAAYDKNSLIAYMTLRIPAASLDDTLGKIRALAVKITNENTSASDQTKQKVDIEAQLKNLQATELQLSGIMKQAKTVSETLEVQQQLTQVRQQIEVLQAEQQNLNSNVAMSTVTVQLQTKAADVTYKSDSFMDEIKLALRDAGQLYRTLFLSGIRNVILLAPVLIIGVVGWGIWKSRQPKTK